MKEIFFNFSVGKCSCLLDIYLIITYLVRIIGMRWSFNNIVVFGSISVSPFHFGIAPKRNKRSSAEVAELKKSVFCYSSELATLKHAEELNAKNKDFLLTLFHLGTIAYG